ncbi:chloramphenicol-sensitive protein RarD [Sphingomonas naasensis]|uniref:EamA family transporter RarD n=1 Tax=Sphingomonas naasensis TaxID=1344951 RepID=A0A4S1W7D4_9SPHN|nr:EamA family transporter RarD [Sphingomonas naasensis]NIJ21344.1 chloramphenicol-sensitive protein RarD [Sphingomonas naasensis]TGX38774.1 EamA family transporter RarD [Sphingomonas naasensis]
MRNSSQPGAAGLAFGVGSYTLWGVLPLYIHLLKDVPALQVLAHRVLWSLGLLLLLIVVLRRAPGILAAARGRTLLLLVGSALMIAINWIVYIWAVQNGHVLEASLGYFINPLVNVALGFAFLGERLRRLQAAAIGVAAIGVLVLAISGGGALWLSLMLALSFGLYGLLRKVAAIDALGGLTVETLLLAPFSVALLLHASQAGTNAFGQSAHLDWLLALAGVVTALPLLLFAAAARRLPLATLGLLQYIAPSLQFAEAVLIFGEPVRQVHIVTFTLIWAGCALYAFDSIRAARTPTPARI